MTKPVEYEHPLSRGNLSAWAVAHPAVVLFLIIVLSVAGLVSYLNLGTVALLRGRYVEAPRPDGRGVMQRFDTRRR
jgi:hypothetical protein